MEKRRSSARCRQRESLLGEIDSLYAAAGGIDGSFLDRRKHRTAAPLSQEEQTRLTRYLALARQLGAEVISTPGTDVGEALLRIAREHNVTQIVIGKPLGSRWTSFLKRDPLRWLMRNSGNIDIHMIPADESARPRREPIEERLARAPWRDFGSHLSSRRSSPPCPCRSLIILVTGLSRFSICSPSFSPPRDYGAGRRSFSPRSARCSGIFSSFLRASLFTSPTSTTS